MSITGVEFNKHLAQLVAPLRAFIVSKMDDANDAEDVLQNTLLRAFENLGHLRVVEEARPWLFTLARYEIRKHFLYEKRNREIELPGAESVSGEERGADLMPQFDYFLERMCATTAGDNAVICATLHLFTQFTRKEIGEAMYLAHSTVCEHVREVKSKLRRSTGKADTGRMLNVRSELVRILLESGISPRFGPHAYNVELCEMGLHVSRETCKRFPEHYQSLFLLMISTYEMARMKEAASSRKPIWLPHDWRRELWDEKLKKEAGETYRRLRVMKMDLAFHWSAEYFHAMNFPSSAEQVDWEYILKTCDQLVQAYPRSIIYWRYATCYRALKGPLFAAKYLEQYKNNKAICSEPYTYYRLGVYYYDANQWDKARRHLKRALKFSLNDPAREYIGQMIKRCNQHNIVE